MMGGPGKLYVVATPIGNLEDITFRAVRILSEVSLIAAEDTRRTRILLKHYDIRTPLTSLYEQNESIKAPFLVGKIKDGQNIACVTDAGTPAISDPGYLLIRHALEAGVEIVPIPGPSALITALSVSGLPMDHFVFQGFLPDKKGNKKAMLLSIKDDPRTQIFYESPNRLLVTLQDIMALMGNRFVVVARELTKIYEEVVRGNVADVMDKQPITLGLRSTALDVVRELSEHKKGACLIVSDKDSVYGIITPREILPLISRPREEVKLPLYIMGFSPDEFFERGIVEE
ncbi:MAG: 16S rRNA (cytidine(1402)-2'-O)-methyltransferase, partial [Syntrophales bacterium]|nr:16S rRNA (cytidine(1402)-2'-O)-methyltransferase [Syntrophales bacterium]